MSPLDLFLQFFDKGLFLDRQQFLEQLQSEAPQIDRSSALSWYQLIVEREILHSLCQKENCTEIIFHSERTIQVHTTNERFQVEPLNISKLEFDLILRLFAREAETAWNFQNPYASFSLHWMDCDWRITLLHHCTSARGQGKLFMRKIAPQVFKLEHFTNSIECQQILIKAVQDKKNILISGATASGKTSLLKSLMQYLPQHEHIAVLEDTHELWSSHPHTTYLLSHNNCPQKSLDQYCRQILRISPDRILLGEMRGPEVVNLILSMNTGHNGVMSTVHANGAVDAIHRLCTLFCVYNKDSLSLETVRSLICHNIHVSVHLEKKCIKQVCQIQGNHGDQVMFQNLFSALSADQANLF